MCELTDNQKAHRVRNESMSLYDMDADETLETQGYVVIDSSLGLVKPRPDEGAKAPQKTKSQ